MSKPHGSHSGGGGTEWMAKHTAGFIVPFGQKFEGFIQKIMFLLINDLFRKVAFLYVVLFTPIILIELLSQFASI